MKNFLVGVASTIVGVILVIAGWLAIDGIKNEIEVRKVKRGYKGYQETVTCKTGDGQCDKCDVSDCPNNIA